MCTPASFFVLLVATLCVSIMYDNQMVTDGFPLSRRERGTEDYEDIIAGNDFLSVFFDSTLNRMKKETTTASEEPIDLFEDVISTEPYLRETREATEYFEEVPQSTERQSINNNFNNNSSNVSNNNHNDDGVIIAVHVSSSVGSSPLINNNNNNYERNIQSINKDANTHQRVFDQNFLTSDDQPNNNLLLVANSGKSELNVEEPVPHLISTKTNNNNEGNINNNLEINKLPSASTQQHIEFNSAEFNGKIINNRDVPSSSSPFHHSLIYHDNPRQSKSGQARSVSYSTIIQDIQPSNSERSSSSSSSSAIQHERKERHYNTGNGYRNIFHQNDAAASEKRQEFSTTTSSSTTTSTTSTTTPTPSVGLLKPFNHQPRRVQNIYGRPEQNYEVDEALSVVTNGRTHGIQQLKSASTEKPNSSGGAEQKDQKVGYVVEGRNYRKYRVEARTPDGFIVGEYGVVSHDDGSLRGVRYTADGTINPRLIYDALMKFLQL